MINRAIFLTGSDHLLRLPEFIPEQPEERTSAARMTRFYRAMGDAAEKYASEEVHIRRYIMEYETKEFENGEQLVTVKISARCSGGGTVFWRRRILHQTWRNGRLASHCIENIQ